MRSNRRVPSIKTTVILLYVTIMVLAAAGIAFLVFTNWSNSIERTLEQMTNTVNEQIHASIEALLLEPMQVNETNRKMIEHGIVDMSDEAERNRFFIGILTSQQDQIYSFSYGTEDGEYFGARRNAQGVVEIMKNDASTGGHSWYYSVNEDLGVGEISAKLGTFDPRTRAWYRAAVDAGTGSFSPLYKHFVMDDLTVSVAWPVYRNGKLQGVLGTHMLLSGIGSYLADAVEEYEGFTLIVEEATGNLVANSMGLDNFSILQDGSLERTAITNIRERNLDALYKRYLASPDEPTFSIGRGKDRTFVNIHHIQLEGLDWLVISGIPGSLLFPQMLYSLNLTIILVMVTLLVSSVLCYLAIRKLFNPIKDLLQVAASISAGELTRRVEVRRDDEIGMISKSLNAVADTLQAHVNDLEAQIDARTEDLQENKNHLQLILDSTAEGVYGIDRDGTCTFCNRSSLQLLGFEHPEDLLGKEMHALIHHSHVDGKPFPVEACGIYQAIRTGKGCANVDEVFWKADGTPFPVSYHAYPQYKDGQLFGGVVTFMDITERKVHDQKLEFLLNHDSLTGLVNRACLEKHAPLLDTPGNYPLSVVFADLNGLKMTNDIFGHAAGDELIKKAAHILLHASRENDVVARIGGDEFLLMLPRTDKNRCAEIMAHIRQGFADAKVEAMKCSISLGSATKSGEGEKLEDVFTEAENEMYKDKTKNRSTVKKEIIDSIQQSLHAMSDEERRHSMNVRDICRRLGMELKLSVTDQARLQRAAYMHDIGKVTLGKTLLAKQQLTDDELELFRQHPAVGYRILNLFDGTLDLADAVYNHHERWDGNGYPRGLHGQQIPLLSRIIAIAEAYERVQHRGGLPESERSRKALQVIIENAGTQFDPDISQAFAHMLGRQRAGNGLEE